VTPIRRTALSLWAHVRAGTRRGLAGLGASARTTGGLLKDAIIGWQDHNCGRMAAAVAYYGIFSLAPILVIMVSVAGFWFGQDAAEGLIVERLTETLGEEGAAFIQSLLARAYVSGAGVAATVIAAVVLLFGASRVVGGVRGALNDIWEVPGRAGGGLKGYVVSKLFDLAMVLVVGFMFLATMIANATVTAVAGRFSDSLPVPDWVLRAGSVAFSLAVVVFFVTFVLRVLPNIRVPWRRILPGAMVTAVLFSIGNYVIGLYLGRAGIGSVFGAAGSLAVIMIWIYYTAHIILFGAELTRSYHRSGRMSPEVPPSSPPPVPAPPRRVRREQRTVAVMVAMYCRDHHDADALCPRCAELLEYSQSRVQRCSFGAEKPTCARCAVHCFRPELRDRIREVMRYSGPRMALRHPYLAARHLLDRRRTPEASL